MNGAIAPATNLSGKAKSVKPPKPPRADVGNVELNTFPKPKFNGMSHLAFLSFELLEKVAASKESIPGTPQWISREIKKRKRNLLKG